jgi:hypothetical protein
MTKGFLFEPTPGRISIVNDSRTVTTTDGTLLCFLPSSEDFTDTIDVVFPDFEKSVTYNHWWHSSYGDGEFLLDEGCITAASPIPQEWEETTILAPAPLGADIIAAMVRINRTVDPSTWGGTAIDVLPKQGEWMPCTGSILVEAELSMSRAFSLYIEDGNLVLHRQQSVSVPPGGFGSYGSSAPTSPGISNGGSNTVVGSEQGFPAYTIQQRDIAAYLVNPGFGNTPPKPVATAFGGGTACSVTDTSDYQSTYSVEIIASFGRRS